MSIKLSNRLGAIAGYISKGAAVADIGADHGLLSVFLAQRGYARYIIASDISAGSLAAARRNAGKYNVTDKIEFVTAPGLSGIGGLDIDTIVIAGMGGETIAGILADAPRSCTRGVKLILQPQTKAVGLCIWLSDNGFVIRDSQRVRDKGRPYVIIMCQG